VKSKVAVILNDCAKTVARFNANSDRANLNCNWDPSNTNSNLGITCPLGHNHQDENTQKPLSATLQMG